MIEQIKIFIKWFSDLRTHRKIALCALIIMFIAFGIAIYQWEWLSSLGANTFIAFGALFTSSVATYVAVDQSILNREHNRLSVKPYITVGAHTVYADGCYKFIHKAKNGGLGPAIIKRYSVFYDGKCIGSSDALQSLKKSIEDKLKELHDSNLDVCIFGKDSSFAAGNEVELIRIDVPLIKNFDSRRYDESMYKFSFHFKCESMYGEKLEFGKQDKKD